MTIKIKIINYTQRETHAPYEIDDRAVLVLQVTVIGRIDTVMAVEPQLDR